MTSIRTPDWPPRRKIFSLDPLDFSKNNEIIETDFVGDETKIQQGDSANHRKGHEQPNGADAYIKKNIQKLLQDFVMIPWLAENKHANAFSEMFVAEINLCLASGLYRSLKKFGHPSFVSRVFFEIQGARNEALEKCKIRFHEYQREHHFSVDANVERTLVVFRKRLRQSLHPELLVKQARQGTSLASLPFQDAYGLVLQQDIEEMLATMPCAAVAARTRALEDALPDIVHQVNAKNRIRWGVLQEFRRDPRTHPATPAPAAHALVPALRELAPGARLDTAEDSLLELSQTQITQSRARDHPLIEASITRHFSRARPETAAKPYARYLSTTVRRAHLVVSEAQLAQLAEPPLESGAPSAGAKERDPVSGISLARFHHKSPQTEIGFNVWDLLYGLIDDDSEVGQGPETAYDVARSQEVEELFEEILRTNPQNDYTLTEPIQAFKFPFIPATSPHAHLMHPSEAPVERVERAAAPELLSRGGHVQMCVRQGHQLNVHADAYAEDRAAAMEETPSAKQSHCRYNYGGYIPAVKIDVKEQVLSAAEYRAFVLRFPNDFLVTAAPTASTTELAPEPRRATAVPETLPTHVPGHWQPAVLDAMPCAHAERFARVIRRLGLRADLALVYALATESVQHDAVKQWEEIARCILRREQALVGWVQFEYEHSHPFRFWGESSVARMNEANERDLLLHQLGRCEDQVKMAIKELKKLPHGGDVPVEYMGRNYLEKMENDKSELMNEMLKNAGPQVTSN